MVNYNSRPFLQDFFNTLKSSAGLPFHLFLFDNCSTDGGVSYIERLIRRDPFWRRVKPKLTVNPRRTALATVWNRGIDCCDGKYVLFLNPDIKLTPGWIEAMIDCAEQFPKAGVVGAKILHFNGIIDHAGFTDGIVFGRGEPDDPYKYQTPVEVDAIHGCCFLVKRSIVPTVGKFDERLFLYGEENDYCIRVRKAGFTVMCSPATIYHFGGGSGIPRDMRLQYLRESAAFLKAKWSH